MGAPATGFSSTPPAQLLDVLARPAGSALMLGHIHPDGDLLGTLFGLGLALEAAGWSVTFAGPHPVPASLAFLPGADRWHVWKQAPGPFEVLVLTDCPNDERTEGLLIGARAPGSDVLNVDHHPDNQRYGTVNWIDPASAATGEMVFDLLQELHLPITRAIALNLFTAIHTDTGSFRYANTTARTFEIAARLTALGADPALVSDRLYQHRPPDALARLGEVLRHVRVSGDGRVAWLAVSRDLATDAFVSGEDLVAYPRSIEGVRVALLLREEAGGVVRASLRGKGGIAVNRIAHRFGGGGHESSAACTLRASLENATATLLAAVSEALDGRGA